MARIVPLLLQLLLKRLRVVLNPTPPLIVIKNNYRSNETFEANKLG